MPESGSSRRARVRTQMESDLERIMKQIRTYSGNVIKGLAIQAVAHISDRMPVDLGWAKANTYPALGLDPPPPALTPETVTALEVAAAQSAQQVAIASLLTASAEDLARLGASVVNPVEYVLYLNDGSSTQAPANFIQDSVDAAIADINKLSPEALASTFGGG